MLTMSQFPRQLRADIPRLTDAPEHIVEHFMHALAASQIEGTMRPKFQHGDRLLTAPSLGIVHFESSGNLVVACDRKIDQALGLWLDRHCAKALNLPNEQSQAKYLQNAVRETFKMGSQPILHPWRARKFRELLQQESNESILLGDFIANDTGLCRHGSLLFQLAAQKVGLVSVMCQGAIAEMDSRTRKADTPFARHAWNVVAISDPPPAVVEPYKVNLVDFMRGTCVLEQFVSPLSQETLVQLFSGSGRKLRATFKKSQAIFVNQLSARNFERDMNQEHAQSLVKFALEHSHQK